MKKLILLLGICLCVAGVHAQESEQDKKCVIEMKNLYRPSFHDNYRDTVTLHPLRVVIGEVFEDKDIDPERYKKLCGGHVIVLDTCNCRDDAFRILVPLGKTQEEQKREFDQKKEQWAARWVKQFVPEEMLTIIKEFMQKGHDDVFNCFWVTSYANAEGDILRVRFRITTEIYEKLMVRQVKEFYQNIKKEKIPFLTEYFFFEKPNLTTSISFDICDLVQKGLI